MGATTSGSLFPGTDELLTYHSPREVAELSADLALPFILKQLGEQAQLTSADFDNTLGLGQLARLMKLGGVESALETWLDEHPGPKANDTAALFLAGFWPGNPNPAKALVERLLTFLAQHGDSLLVVETFLLALSPTLATQDHALREQVRGAFRQLLPLYPLLQTTSQTLLRYGIPIPKDQLPPARPDASEFRAYYCEEAGGTYVAIEHLPSGRETVKVLSIVEDAGTLRVSYQINVLVISDRFAQDLIWRTVLLDLCQDRFRKSTKQIEYSNPSRRKSTVVPYQ